MKNFYPTHIQLDAIEKLALRRAAVAEAELAKRRKAKPESKPAEAAKLERVAAAIKEFDGDRAPEIAKLMAIVMDEPKLVAMVGDDDDDDDDAVAAPIRGFFSKKNGWLRGAAVVALHNRNSHDYELGDVIFMAGIVEGEDDYPGRRGWTVDSDGELIAGNNLGRGEGDWRPATAAEIKKAIADAKSNIEGSGKITASNPFGSALTEED